ncbi:Uncharacterised protein [Mycobacteroides abscessus subsp. abscessus]|nr:hypothetical protein [Mycobacteroides abscessus]SLJ23767.1 Uncharacterised protein [Mycobacteroides abscessus subsp. abscessus]
MNRAAGVVWAPWGDEVAGMSDPDVYDRENVADDGEWQDEERRDE